MKYILYLGLLLSTLSFAQGKYSENLSETPISSQVHKYIKKQTLYITKTGKKYHRSHCRYLKNSKIPISRKKAQNEGYTPCRICKP